MSSAAQIAANRANSQLSTGPSSPEGKARSSQNARKEGFSAQTLHIAPHEQPEFDDYRRSVLHDTRPDGAIENEFVRRILLSGWNLRRISALEAQLVAESDPAHDDQAAARLHRLARYRRDLERSYDRALAELRRLQTQRAVLLQQHDSAVSEVLAHTPMAELSAITAKTDAVLRNLNHPLRHAATQFSRIRRDGAGTLAVAQNEVISAEAASHDALALAYADLPEAGRCAFAALAKEVA
jgi:hypothetical protein